MPCSCESRVLRVLQYCQHLSPCKRSARVLSSGRVRSGQSHDTVPNCCRYYQEKGFWVIVTARVLNLLALGFTAAFSGFLLLWVDWGALRAECIQQDTCDILEVGSAPLTDKCSKSILRPIICRCEHGSMPCIWVCWLLVPACELDHRLKRDAS